MLPSAKDYLIAAGFGPQRASFLLIGLFLAGVLGIQVLSRAMHHFLPSHIVDCDHTHGDEEADRDEEDVEVQRSESDPDYSRQRPRPSLKISGDRDDEQTPLLYRDSSLSPIKNGRLLAPDGTTVERRLSAHGNGALPEPNSLSPSIIPKSLTKTLTKLAPANMSCDETGPCKGFSDPCGQHCFKGAARRNSVFPLSAPPRQSSFHRTSSTSASLRNVPPVPVGDLEEPNNSSGLQAASGANGISPPERSHSTTYHFHHPVNGDSDAMKPIGQHGNSSSSWHSDGRAEHHHHVPKNAFLSIGLQTSIAIALHKAPEGFITYATNHANPTLGFSVFMALFIHNITEGFAMALPLYLALQSRTKAILWSSFLGGVSQPMGAGVAALWFKLAKGAKGIGTPGEDVYGCMFAITSGIMASVALQLFSESLGLNHHKTVCIGFAFLGMGILGLSSALMA
jgi:zinc transporter, ZIP family